MKARLVYQALLCWDSSHSRRMALSSLKNIRIQRAPSKGWHRNHFHWPRDNPYHRRFRVKVLFIQSQGRRVLLHCILDALLLTAPPLTNLPQSRPLTEAYQDWKDSCKRCRRSCTSNRRERPSTKHQMTVYSTVIWIANKGTSLLINEKAPRVNLTMSTKDQATIIIMKMIWPVHQEQQWNSRLMLWSKER